MWGRKDDPNDPLHSMPGTPPETHEVRPIVNPPLNRPSAVAAAPKVAKAGTSIGHTIKLKADISGDEDLRIDGELEGRIELPKSNVFIGPSGKVTADVQARSIVIEGRIHGNLEASEKIDIRKTGTLEGDIVTVGISIEEGAMFRGSVDIVRRDEVPAKPISATKKSVASDTGVPALSGAVREARAGSDSS